LPASILETDLFCFVNRSIFDALRATTHRLTFYWSSHTRFVGRLMAFYWAAVYSSMLSVSMLRDAPYRTNIKLVFHGDDGEGFLS